MVNEKDILESFIKNVTMLDEIRNDFKGNFVAVCGQKVVGVDEQVHNLWSKLGEYKNNQELFVSYVPMDNEILLL